MQDPIKISLGSLIFSIIGLFIFVQFCYWLFLEVWPGNVLETDGIVTGYGCADKFCNNQDCCSVKYSIIRFRDARGVWHITNDPADNLTGKVVVRYHFVDLPGGVNLGIKVDREGKKGLVLLVYPVFIFSGLLFFVSGITGHWFGILKKQYRIQRIHF